jgi:phospholipid-transporting ATPase
MLFFPVYAFVAPLLGFSQEYQGILPHLFGSLAFWATIVVVPVMCLIRDFAWK